VSGERVLHIQGKASFYPCLMVIGVQKEEFIAIDKEFLLDL
jgi:hypothetical protein